jgi:hypothetical protein
MAGAKLTRIVAAEIGTMGHVAHCVWKCAWRHNACEAICGVVSQVKLRVSGIKLGNQQA